MHYARSIILDGVLRPLGEIALDVHCTGIVLHLRYAVCLQGVSSNINSIWTRVDNTAPAPCHGDGISFSILRGLDFRVRQLAIAKCRSCHGCQQDYRQQKDRGNGKTYKAMTEIPLQ